jgi:7-carboxy-7-deazaguanine synthase
MRTDATLWIAETFVSIQGEGRLTGTPSLFIRTSGCNLRCHFCDTPYTSWQARGEHLAIDALLAPLDEHPRVAHAVVTGGEPMIAKNVEALVGALKDRGLHVTIETAGTAYLPLPTDLWSISPKLSSSAPPFETSWRDRHNATRVNNAVIERMMRDEHQLKFVAGSARDVVEIAHWVERLSAAPDNVMVMPEGTSVEELDAVARWLAPEVIARGWRYCDRLHIRLFGHTPGT